MRSHLENPRPRPQVSRDSKPLSRKTRNSLLCAVIIPMPMPCLDQKKNETCALSALTTVPISCLPPLRRACLTAAGVGGRWREAAIAELTVAAPLPPATLPTEPAAPTVAPEPQAPKDVTAVRWSAFQCSVGCAVGCAVLFGLRWAQARARVH